MANPSEVVVLKGAHAPFVHGIHSLESTNALGYTPSIAPHLCTDTTKTAPVTCSKHSDSFQNIFGIDGYLRSHQNFQTNPIYYTNNTVLDYKSPNVAVEYVSRISICLLCEEENTMNNNIKTCNHICERAEVSQKLNDEQHSHEVVNFISEYDGTDDLGRVNQSENISNHEKYYEALHVECQMAERHSYKHKDSGMQELSHEHFRPFSLSVVDQLSHKQNALGVGSITLLGLSSGTKINSNIFLENKSINKTDYSTLYEQPLLTKQNDNSEHTDLKEPRELSSEFLNQNRAGLQRGYTCGPPKSMVDSGDVFRREDKNVKENCFHTVEGAIQKMTLQKTQEKTSFDSCTCINPGSSHACATRAPTYGILNPLFDDSLRNSFLERNAHSDKGKSLQISEKPLSSSFEPMNLWLPPLANAPNTQGLDYYLPYCLPLFPNGSINSKHNSLDSIVSMVSEKGELFAVPSASKSADTNSGMPLTQMERNRGMKNDQTQNDHLSGSRKDTFSKPKNNGRRESSTAKNRSSFLSPASGEITLPYTPPDIQEELMFPNTSYGKGTEIIQNLNAHEKYFYLGRPTRTPRANDIFDHMKRGDGNSPYLQINEHGTKKLETMPLTGHKPQVRETCMTGVTKIKPKCITLVRDVEKFNGVLRSSDFPSNCQENKNKLLNKTLSLPIEIPLKLDNFDRDDYVSYKNETHAPEMNIPDCLRLNCLDPCREGVCLNSIEKSYSLTNFNELSEQTSGTESEIVDENLSQRRSSDSFIHNRSNLKQCYLGKKFKIPGISVDARDGKQDKFACQAVGKEKNFFTQQRSILREDVELEAGKSDNQQEIGQDKMNVKHSDLIKSNYELNKARDLRAPVDDEQSRIGQFECHEISFGVTPRKQNLNESTPPVSEGTVVKKKSHSRKGINVKDYHQSSFSSDDGTANSASSASQESSDNSNESRKGLSLLDRRRNAAKRKDRLKLKIADRSSSEEIQEGYELGAHFLRNDELNVQGEITEKNQIQRDSQTSLTEDHSLVSLVDDLTNYWLDSPSPNSLTPYPFLESPGDLTSRTEMHSITKYPEASGFSRELDLTCSTKTATNSETKYKKKSRAAATKSVPTVFENPVSMANCSPDSDKTLTREIVRNIIEEKRSRSKSNSASSPSDYQIDTTHATRESLCHRKEETHHSPDANTSVPYEPLVTPSPMTPCGGFLGGSTPLLPGRSGESFSSSVDLTNDGMREDAAVFHPEDFGRSSDERITPQKAGCLESSGAISKRSSIPMPSSDRPKRLHNRHQDSHRPHHQHLLSHPHNHKRPPPSSSSSDDEATSSDSSSSDSSSSSGSSSSTSESSSDLEDIVHLRP